MRVWIVSGLWLLAAPVFPQTGQTPEGQQPPILSVEVDTMVVTVGDPITLRVSVAHGAGAQVLWPDSLDLGPFDVTAVRALPDEVQGERVRSSMALTLAAFELGDLEIPSFDVEVVTGDGERTTLATNSFGIQVRSVGLDEGGDIREIRGPLGIPLSPARVLLFILGALVAAYLVWAVYKRAMRSGEVAPGSAPARPWRPPHEVALEALARLEASPLLDEGEVKEFHIQASDILRRYVETRFQVPALEMTTGEVLSGLDGVLAESAALQGFDRFLDSCDMVKFAKHRPSEQDSLSLLHLGRQLVEETTPVPRTSDQQTVEDTVPDSGPSPSSTVPDSGPPPSTTVEEASP